jgi:glycosyltransferase involved in cell wall biosynthesis
MHGNRSAPARSPDITVVIPTRDRWTLLERAVRSALEQEGVVTEVIVVDDASDRTPTATHELEDERVRIIRLQNQCGVSAARNAGTREARAPWIGFLDDDDFWAPQRARTLLESAERADAGWAYSSALAVDETLRPLALLQAPEPETLIERLVRDNPIPGGGSTLIARSSVLQRCDGWDESFGFAADWDLWLRLSQAEPAAAVKMPLFAYQQHPGSWSMNPDPSAHRDIEQLPRKHAAIIERLNGRISRAGLDSYFAHSLWWSGFRLTAARRYLVAGIRNRDPRTLIRAPGALLTPKMASRLRLTGPIPETPSWLAASREAAFGAR